MAQKFYKLQALQNLDPLPVPTAAVFATGIYEPVVRQTAEWKNFILILVNDQLDALFLNVFISCLYTFRATSAHYQEDRIVLIHHLV